MSNFALPSYAGKGPITVTTVEDTADLILGQLSVQSLRNHNFDIEDKTVFF